jgi:hypothetical protein
VGGIRTPEPGGRVDVGNGVNCEVVYVDVADDKDPASPDTVERDEVGLEGVVVVAVIAVVAVVSSAVGVVVAAEFVVIVTGVVVDDVVIDDDTESVVVIPDIAGDVELSGICVDMVLVTCELGEDCPAVELSTEFVATTVVAVDDPEDCDAVERSEVELEGFIVVVDDDVDDDDDDDDDNGPEVVAVIVGIDDDIVVRSDINVALVVVAWELAGDCSVLELLTGLLLTTGVVADEVIDGVE